MSPFPCSTLVYRGFLFGSAVTANQLQTQNRKYFYASRNLVLITFASDVVVIIVTFLVIMVAQNEHLYRIAVFWYPTKNIKWRETAIDCATPLWILFL